MKTATKPVNKTGVSIEIQTTVTAVKVVETVAKFDKNPELEADILAFNTAKEMIKNFKVQQKEAETKILEALKGAKVCYIDGRKRVTVSDRSGTHLNGEILKTAFPEAYEAAVYETPYQVVLAN